MDKSRTPATERVEPGQWGRVGIETFHKVVTAYVVGLAPGTRVTVLSIGNEFDSSLAMRTEIRDFMPKLVKLGWLSRLTGNPFWIRTEKQP